MIIMLFMAITSTGAAECVAVSSLVAYDVFRKYVDPGASGARVLLVSRATIVSFGLAMGGFACVLEQAGLTLNWVARSTPESPATPPPSQKLHTFCSHLLFTPSLVLFTPQVYNFMGIIIGGAVVPVAYLLTWCPTPAWRCSCAHRPNLSTHSPLPRRGASAAGAVAGAWAGQLSGIVAWLSVAAAMPGGVSVTTTDKLEAQLAGNIASIGVSGVVCTVISLLRPQAREAQWLTRPRIAPSTA